MNREIMKKLGFQEEIKAVEGGLCPFCRNQIDLRSFRDSLSRKEHEISGLCQSCQDEMFGL